MTLSDLIPDPQVVLEMAPEELAGPLLQCLIHLSEHGTKPNRYNFTLHCADECPADRREDIGFAVAEAPPRWILLSKCCTLSAATFPDFLPVSREHWRDR